MIRNSFPTLILILSIGVFNHAFLQGVIQGVQAINVTPSNVQQKRSNSAWNNMIHRSSWPINENEHEHMKRQTSSGNRTEDLFTFFSADLPPAQCSLECEIIWGAVSACELRSCVCSESYGREFIRCCDCLLEPPSATKADYYQGLLTEFGQGYCSEFNVPRLILGEGTTSSGPPSNPHSGSPVNSPGGSGSVVNSPTGFGVNSPSGGSGVTTECGANCNGNGGIPPPSTTISSSLRSIPTPIVTSRVGESQDVANGATYTEVPNLLTMISACMLAVFSGIVIIA